MRRFLLVPLALIFAGALRADDVYLQNGRTFEGVIVAERDDELDLQLPGGTISIPRSSVREIVPSDSPYTEYLSRADELRRTDAEALRWVELARWARAQDMETAARAAALEAAALDPTLAEVAPVMRSLGYEFDGATKRWLPFEEAMRARGLVSVDGSWITREEAAELRRRREEERRDRQAAERLEHAAAEMRLAAAEMESRARYDAAPNYEWWGIPYAPYYWPVGVRHPGAPGFRPDRPRPTPHAPPAAPRRVEAPAAGGKSHGGVARPQGSAGRGSTALRSTSTPGRR